MENKITAGRTALLVLFLSIVVDCAAATPETPRAVLDFYGSMRAMATATDPNRAYDLQKLMSGCFYGNDELASGIDIPNDFKRIGHDRNTDSHDYDFLTASNYINKLYQYIYKEKVMKVEYKPLRSEYFGIQPEFARGRLGASETPCIRTFVSKTYTVDGQKYEFNEIIYTDIGSGKIYEISNGGEIKSYKIKAAEAYRNGDYAKAYDCYERIVQMDRNDKDALYRLALMTYYRKGCQLPRKEAHRKGKAYMGQVGTWQARNVLHYWEYPVL